MEPRVFSPASVITIFFAYIRIVVPLLLRFMPKIPTTFSVHITIGAIVARLSPFQVYIHTKYIYNFFIKFEFSLK